jgi:hypothetical protein
MSARTPRGTHPRPTEPQFSEGIKVGHAGFIAATGEAVTVINIALGGTEAEVRYQDGERAWVQRASILQSFAGISE